MNGTSAAHTARPGQLFRGAAATLVAQGSSIVGSLVVGIVVARTLGPSGKGQLTVIQQVAWIASALSGLGLSTAMSYFVGSGRRPATQAFSDSLAAALLIGLPVSAIIFLVMRWLMPALSGVGTTALLLGCTLVPLTMVTSYISAIEVGRSRVPTVAVAQTAAAIITITVLVGAAVLGSVSILLVVAAQVAALAATAGLMGRDIRSERHRLLERPSFARLREQASFSAKAYVGEIANLLVLRQDVVLLGLLATASSVGVYSVGVAFVELAWFLPNSITQALFARSVRAEAEEGAKTAALTIRLTGEVTFVVVVALMLLVKTLIDVMFGARFQCSAAVFWILSPGVLLMGLGRIASHHLGARGVLLPKVAASAALANLIGNLVAIPLYGYLGAAAVSSVTYSMYGTYLLLEFARHTKTRLVDVLLPRREDAALAMAAVTRLVRRPDK